MKQKTVDISGFGGGYEKVCQVALWTGIKYLAKCDKPEDLFKGTVEFQNITGIAITPESAKELEDLWRSNPALDGWTGAQHQAVVGHLRFIAKEGYLAWIKKFEKEPNRVYEIDMETLFS